MSLSFFCAGDAQAGDVQTKSLNVDIMVKVKEAWDGIMALLGCIVVLWEWLMLVNDCDELSLTFTVADSSFYFRIDEFNGMQTEMPLEPKAGGQIHPTDFKLLPAEGGTYVAGGNVSWISPYWAAQSVPLISSAITSLVHGKFRTPRALEVTVLVNSKSDPKVERHRIQSLLRRISPEEEHLAYILATWRDVSQGINVQD